MSPAPVITAHRAWWTEDYDEYADVVPRGFSVSAFSVSQDSFLAGAEWRRRQVRDLMLARAATAEATGDNRARDLYAAVALLLEADPEAGEGP